MNKNRETTAGKDCSGLLWQDEVRQGSAGPGRIGTVRPGME